MTIDITRYAAMPLEKLKTELVKEAKPIRRATYEWLYANRRDDALAVRPVLEALRGTKRDEAGHIIRSKEWKKQRLAALEEKSADIDRRKKRITKLISALKADLAGKEAK